MDEPPLTSRADSEIPERRNDYAGTAPETVCPDSYGLEIVYQGGICIDLDLALYEAIGRDSTDEGCNLHSQRRDMFWRCADIEEALTIRANLIRDIETHPDFSSVAASRGLWFKVKTEDEHWETKLAALDGPSATASTDPSPTDEPRFTPK